MIDDLTTKEKGFSDDFDLDEEKRSNELLIVKKNFYVSTNVKDEFIFVKILNSSEQRTSYP